MFKKKLSPLIVTLLVSALLLPAMFGFFYIVDSLEQREQLRSLQHRAQTQFQKIESAFFEITIILQALRSLTEINPELSSADFDDYISAQSISDYGISAFEWLPKVKVSQLADWEAKVRSSGQFNFQTNYNPLNQDRRIVDIFPIKYSSSSQMHGFSLGNNLAQDSRFAALLLKAQRTSSVQLAISRQSFDQQAPISRFLLAAYSDDSYSYSSLQGYVAASFNLEEAINVLLGNSLSELNLCLQVTKAQGVAADLTVYQSSCDIQHNDNHRWQIPYNLAGEQLLFNFYDFHSSDSARFISATELATLAFLISALLSLYYLYSSRRYALKIENLVQLKQERLEDITEDYSKLFLLSLDGIYKASIKGDLLKANPAFAGAFSYISKEQVCHRVTDISSQLHVSEESYQRFIETLLEQGQVTNYEWQGVGKDNQPVWLIENAYLIKDDSGAAIAYQGFISIISERKQAEQKLLYQAEYDSLTGLRNRASFVRLLEQQIKNHNCGSLAMFFIDIDRFKSINDSFGHAVGDELLIQFANRLKSCFVTGEVARFGGDEFAIFHTQVSSKTHLQQLSQQILQKMQPSFGFADEHKLTITASIGTSLLTTNCQGATEALLQADLAMYQVKHSGRNNSAIYDVSLSVHIERRLKLEIVLKDALVNTEFSVVYQPVMDLKSQQVAGFEALLRWHNPEFGAVSPVEFIPILEELNLIAPVGAWVMREAVKQLSFFIAASGNPQLFINVNVSPKQLISSDIATLIEQQLFKFKLQPANINIEVTETQLYTDESTLMQQLHRIDKLAVGIYIDDFGTGHSSLERLVNYPLQGIKLDRSFVSNLQMQSNNAIVLKATVRMANLLGLKVTVEGIEESYQQDFFTLLGCQYAQGYLYNKPLPAAQATALISSETIIYQSN
ncbi:MAG: hypothetical protein OFPI_36640 [Osedax symbiont Rs2]|nr:MAG: hypothetical protein OFPI_36640 [Osedax symbiont Rs2]